MKLNIRNRYGGILTPVIFLSMYSAFFISFNIDNTVLSDQGPAKVTVVGILSRVVVIGGETTGWMMELNRSFLIYGKPLLEIDVDPRDQSVEKYRDKHVKLSGNVTIRKGKERGEYLVIELETIQLAETN
jgi:hypothetical protein